MFSSVSQTGPLQRHIATEYREPDRADDAESRSSAHDRSGQRGLYQVVYSGKGIPQALSGASFFDAVKPKTSE